MLEAHTTGYNFAALVIVSLGLDLLWSCFGFFQCCARCTKRMIQHLPRSTEKSEVAAPLKQSEAAGPLQRNEMAGPLNKKEAAEPLKQSEAVMPLNQNCACAARDVVRQSAAPLLTQEGAA